MAGMLGLGRVFDLGAAVTPHDLSGGAVTGKRIHLDNCSALTVVVYKGAASTGTDPAFTFGAYAASSGGSKSTAYTGPTSAYVKAAATLAGTETWAAKTVKSSGGDYALSSNIVTLTGEEGNEGIYVFEVYGSQLPDGYPYFEVDSSDAGTVAQLGGVLYIKHDLTVQRTPTNLPAQNS